LYGHIAYRPTSSSSSSSSFGDLTGAIGCAATIFMNVSQNSNDNTYTYVKDNFDSTNGYPVNCSIIKRQAIQIANDMMDHHHPFQAVNGWVKKWEKRYNIQQQKSSIKGTMVDSFSVALL
jgi:Tc5 transposase DNA-binding domain